MPIQILSFLRSIKKKLHYYFIQSKRETAPEAAYDIWASTYDEQSDNPLIYLDEAVFSNMLDRANLEGKIIVDIGCGTGKHWGKILPKRPLEVIGYDISGEMLTKLQQKYPAAKVYLSNDNILKELKDNSCDMVVSALVIGYIKDLTGTFAEWNRVLKKNGEIIITDFHPVSLQKGATRSFKHNDKLIYIRNYTHSLNKIKSLANKMQWEQICLTERKVDESIRSFFERGNVLDVYENAYGTPILYGWYFRKK